jgi:mono/diheme cytochrome c family protein
MKARRVAEGLIAAVCAGACLALPPQGTNAAMKHGRPLNSARAEVARGKYLVTFGACTDCHTPGSFFGKPDITRFLGGSDVGFEILGVRVFVAQNLTPDSQTGLGSWSEQQIVAAVTTGKIPDERILAPIMPWHAYANLTKSDALAIAAYLESLPPVSHQVGGPYGANEIPKESVMVVVPPSVYSNLPKLGGSAPAATAPPPAESGK